MKQIGIDIGGTSIIVGVVQSGKLLDYREIRNTFAGMPENMANGIIELIKELQDMDNISFIGAGLPGGIREGVVYDAVNLGFHEVSFEKTLHEKTKKVVRIENDATAALIGEFMHGALQGIRNSILLTLGTGVGGGMIFNGRVYKGSHCSAGEFGHVLYERGGHRCTCGKFGCFEQYASAAALMKMLREELQKGRNSILLDYCNGEIETINGRMFFKAAGEEDPLSLEILEKFTYYVADGICDFLNILDVERVAIGGGISEAGEVLLSPIREKVRKRGFEAEIVAAALGNKAAVVGSASMYEMEGLLW